MKHRSRFFFLCLACAIVLGSVAAFGNWPPGVVAQEAPGTLRIEDFAVSLEPVVDGLTKPVFLTNAGAEDDRMFIVEQPGLIRIIADGELLPEPFLDIQDRVESQGSEQGLLSVAFHPEYATNGQFFVGYTARSETGVGDNTISRFSVSAENPDRADPTSEQVLIAIPDRFPNHNGGMVAFGPDGYLYAGFGDGGSQGDPDNNGQNPNTLFGSLVRLDVDNPAGGLTYGVPDDNPYLGGGVGRPEVWATGLRNPWRFSFDRETGDLYIGDVGQSAIEEVDFLPAGSPGGANFGWNLMEGSTCYTEPACTRADLTLPVAEYSHDLGCSVTGGYVSRGEETPSLNGYYLYADYCTGYLWGLVRDENGVWLTSEPVETGLTVSSFGEDSAGNLYVLDLRGSVYRINAGEQA